MPLSNPDERREYHRAYMREVWYPANKAKHVAMVTATKARKRRFLAEMKTNAGCRDCGYNKSAEALDFDHLRDKEFTISSHLHQLGWSKLLAEIAKCEVVCANCHRERTEARRAVE